MVNAKLLKGGVHRKYVPSQRSIRPSRDKERQVLLQNLICPLVVQALDVGTASSLLSCKGTRQGDEGFVLTAWPPHIVPMRVSAFQAVYSSCLQCKHTLRQQYMIRKLDVSNMKGLPYVLSSTATPNKYLSSFWEHKKEDLASTKENR